MDIEEYEKQRTRVAQYRAWSEQLARLESLSSNLESGCTIQVSELESRDAIVVSAWRNGNRNTFGPGVELDKSSLDAIRELVVNHLKERITGHIKALENL